MDEVLEALQAAAIPQAVELDLPDDDQLVEIEEEMLLPIPASFKEFLLNASNLVVGSLEPVTVCDPYAHTHLPEITAQAWSDGLPREFMVLCEFGSGCYCVNSEGEVLLWQDGKIDDDQTWQDVWQWAYEVWLES
jgi:hypothetical protein